MPKAPFSPAPAPAPAPTPASETPASKVSTLPSFLSQLNKLSDEDLYKIAGVSGSQSAPTFNLNPKPVKISESANTPHWREGAGSNKVLTTSPVEMLKLISQGDYTAVDVRHQQAELGRALARGDKVASESIKLFLGYSKALEQYRTFREQSLIRLRAKHPELISQFEEEYPETPDLIDPRLVNEVKIYAEEAVTQAEQANQVIKEHPFLAKIQDWAKFASQVVSTATMGVFEGSRTEKVSKAAKVAGYTGQAVGTAALAEFLPAAPGLALVRNILGATAPKAKFAAEVAASTGAMTYVIDPLFEKLKQEQPYNYGWLTAMQFATNMYAGYKVASWVGNAWTGLSKYAKDPAFARFNVLKYASNYMGAQVVNAASKGDLTRFPGVRQWFLKYSLGNPNLTQKSKRILGQAIARQQPDLIKAVNAMSLKDSSDITLTLQSARSRVAEDLYGPNQNFLKADIEEATGIYKKLLDKTVGQIEALGLQTSRANEGLFRPKMDSVLKQSLKDYPELQAFIPEITQVYFDSGVLTESNISNIAKAAAKEVMPKIYIRIESELTAAHIAFERYNPLFDEEVDRVASKSFTIAKQLKVKQANPNLFPELNPLEYPELQELVDTWNTEAFGDFSEAAEYLYPYARQKVMQQYEQFSVDAKELGWSKRGLTFMPGEDVVKAKLRNPYLQLLAGLDAPYIDSNFKLGSALEYRGPALDYRNIKSKADIDRAVDILFDMAKPRASITKIGLAEQLRLGELFGIVDSNPGLPTKSYTTWSYDPVVELSNNLYQYDAATREKIDFSKLKLTGGLEARVPKQISTSEAIQIAKQNKTKLPGELKRDLKTLETTGVPDISGLTPEEQSVYNEISSRLSNSVSPVSEAGLTKLENAYSTLDLAAEDKNTLESIILKIDDYLARRQQVFKIKQGAAGEFSLSEAELAFLEAKIPGFTNQEVAAEDVAGFLKETMPNLDGESQQVAKQLIDKIEKGGSETDSALQRQARERLTKYAEEITNKKLSKAESEFINTRYDLATKGVKALLNETIDSFSVGKPVKKQLKQLVKYYYDAVKRDPHFSSAQANDYVITKLQGMTKGLQSHGVELDMANFLTRVLGSDAKELLKQLERNLQDPTAKEVPAIEARIRQLIRSKADKPKKALQRWETLFKRLRNQSVVTGKPIGELRAVQGNPFVPTTVTDDEMRDGIQNLIKILQDSEDPLHKYIETFSKQNAGAFPKEVTQMMSMKDVFERELQNAVNQRFGIRDVSKSPTIKRVLAVDKILQEESQGLIDTPQEEPLRRVRVKFLDKLRGTNSLDAYLLSSNTARSQDFMTALTADVHRNRIGRGLTPQETLTKTTDFITELLQAADAPKDILSQTQQIQIKAPGSESEVETKFGRIDIPESILRYLGFSRPEDILSLQTTSPFKTLLTDSKEDLVNQIRINEVLNDFFGLSEADLSSSAINLISKGKTTDPLFMHAASPQDFKEIAESIGTTKIWTPKEIIKDLGISHVSERRDAASNLMELYGRIESQMLKRLSVHNQRYHQFFNGEANGAIQKYLYRAEASNIINRKSILMLKAIREQLETGNISTVTQKALAQYKLDFSSPRALYNSWSSIIEKEMPVEFGFSKQDIEKIYTGPTTAAKTEQYTGYLRQEMELEDALIRQVLNAKEASQSAHKAKILRLAEDAYARTIIKKIQTHVMERTNAGVY